jgi:hypothetical protein
MSKSTVEQKDRRNIYNRACRRNNEIELAYYSRESISFSGARGFFVSPADAALMRKWLVQGVQNGNT